MHLIDLDLTPLHFTSASLSTSDRISASSCSPIAAFVIPGQSLSSTSKNWPGSSTEFPLRCQSPLALITKLFSEPLDLGLIMEPPRLQSLAQRVPVTESAYCSRPTRHTTSRAGRTYNSEGMWTTCVGVTREQRPTVKLKCTVNLKCTSQSAVSAALLVISSFLPPVLICRLRTSDCGCAPDASWPGWVGSPCALSSFTRCSTDPVALMCERRALSLLLP
ncbi:hypothetical protein JB92DRAFT_2865043 [Gautieria morchelliformis]|nr:hypothetical protein JB92DRAFT_2865043 [Gautieria morchelliformis]